MITKNQLYDLGYTEKDDNIDMIDGSTDFKHEDFKKRTYLVNLNNGYLTIGFPINSRYSAFSTNEYEKFKLWLDNY